MPRAPKAQFNAEDDPLPTRSTARKRKIVEYAEVDSHEDDVAGESDPAADSDATNGYLASPKDRRKVPNPFNSRRSTSGQVQTPRRREAPEADKLSRTEINTSATVPQANGGAKEEHQAVYETAVAQKSPSKSKRKPKAQGTQALDPDHSDVSSIEATAKPKRKRKTKEEREAEAMPLAARTLGLRMYVGAHTSIAKGVENAITNAVHIGGNAFACFLKSQRKWDNPALKDENRDAFKSHLITHSYDATRHIVPHGSYLVNLASSDEEMARKSYDAFVDDLRRCEALGIRYYNFHPGAAGQSPLDEAIGRLASNLNRALSETTVVVPLLENMATRGSIIGGRFSDLSAVIKLIKPEFKSRIGVCIDTCHAFASGYDLCSPDAFKETLQGFDETVGIGYLRALHLNDSKAPLASNRDLHQNIGLGFLGLRAFHNVMNEPRFQDLPLILETPCEKPDPSDPKGKKTLEDRGVWAKEIKLLESLIGMDPESKEFKQLEKELSDRGKAERAKMQRQFEEKLEKAKKKLVKDKERGQKSLKDMLGGGRKKRKDSQKDYSSDSEPLGGD